jgi:group II intron reverse transcriptase/maturase
MNEHVSRPVPVTMKMVADAYQKVRRGGNASGIDGQSWNEFEKNVEDNLYVLWNRMSSGSYFPSAVREVEIPKKDGSKRKLGIPTLKDRIAQCVVKDYMEKQLDSQFSEASHGYRPMRGSQEAIEKVRQNCFTHDWVVDMDIAKFFDEIDHELLMKAVEWMIEEKWVKMYVRRWLEMKIQGREGKGQEREGKGTPQGGVISPLLANVFLHVALDKWLEKNYSEVSFVRYADDMIIHCHSREQAEALLKGIEKRLEEVKLRLNKEKSRIVYCKDYKRKENQKETKFEFLGFSYQPRSRQSRHNQSTYLAFTAEISEGNAKKIRDEIRELKEWRDTKIEVEQIAGRLNSRLRGWINYFGRYSRKKLRHTLHQVDICLIKWLQRRYKLKSIRRAMVRVEELKSKMKTEGKAIFYHWGAGYS